MFLVAEHVVPGVGNSFLTFTFRLGLPDVPDLIVWMGILHISVELSMDVKSIGSISIAAPAQPPKTCTIMYPPNYFTVSRHHRYL